jgi:hypothetical protein
MSVRSMLVLVAVLAGCPRAVECPPDSIVNAEGECVEVDDTDSDSDTDPVDTDPVDGGAIATMTVEWDVELLPNDNTLTVVCDGREILSETNFVARKTYDISWDETAGSVCEIRMSDSRGGNLAGGRLINCSSVVASWDTRRSSSEETVATHTVFGCNPGCPDPVALNYDPAANEDDGSCNYIFGCMDSRAFNYNPQATKDDGTCDYGGFGIVALEVTTNTYPDDTFAILRCDGFEVIREENFSNPNATYRFEALVDAGFDCEAVIGDRVGDEGAGGRVEICGQEVAKWRRTGQAGGVGGVLAEYEEVAATFFMTACSGCTNPFSPEFDPVALVDDGTCTIP